jgi:hypothetical protein
MNTTLFTDRLGGELTKAYRMHSARRRRRRIALSLAVLLIGISASASAATIILYKQLSLNTVAQSTLLGGGITLFEPANASTSASSETSRLAAETAASESLYGASVRESRYAHCVAEGIDQDCWVVSLDPSQVRSHGPVQWKASFFVALVDPSTDRVLLAEAGSPIKLAS